METQWEKGAFLFFSQECRMKEGVGGGGDCRYLVRDYSEKRVLFLKTIVNKKFRASFAVLCPSIGIRMTSSPLPSPHPHIPTLLRARWVKR